MSTATYAPTNPATALGDPMRSGVGATYGPGFGLDPQLGQYGQQYGQLSVAHLLQQSPFQQQNPFQPALFQQSPFQQQNPFQQSLFQQNPYQQHQLQQAIAQHVQQTIAQQVQQAQIQQAIVQQVQQQQIQQAIAQQIQQQMIQQAIARHWQQGHPGAQYGSFGSPYGQQMWN